MKKITALSLCLWSLPCSARGAEPGSPPGSLAEVLALAEQRNPEILAAKKGWQAALSRAAAAKTWPDPELELEFEGFPRASLSAGSASEKRYGLAQSFPFPGKLRLRGRSARHAAQREENLYHATWRETLAGVKAAYYALLLAERATGIFNESAELMRKFAKIAEAKYAVSKVPQSDVLRSQVELSKMLNELLNSGAERETAAARLNALLDRDPEAALGPLAEPPAPSAEISFARVERLALASRPELLAAGHHVEHMKAELAAGRLEYLPDTMLQYSWRTMAGSRPDAVAMLRFNLPFAWFWGRRALNSALERDTEHAEAMLRSARAMARYEAKEFLVHVQTSRRLVELYKTTVIPQAEQSLKVTEAGYQSDRVGFLELLDSQRALLEFKLEYFKSLAQYGTNLAHLERVVGAELGSPSPEDKSHD